MAAKKPPMPVSLLFERILAIVTTLGLICLFVGLPLYITGKASSNLVVDQVGTYILLTGIFLLAMRIFYWIAEEIVGRGLESIAKQDQ
jgi:predicted tellurium resistance membrane protein TerC